MMLFIHNDVNQDLIDLFPVFYGFKGVMVENETVFRHSKSLDK